MAKVSSAEHASVIPLVDLGPDRYRALNSRLPRLLDSLRSAPAIERGRGSTFPRTAGVYLFAEDGAARYVGQTRDLRRRITQHCAGYSQQNQATFAFLLARQEAEADPRIDLRRSRKALSADPRFADMFRRTRERVSRMAVRYVEVDDPELRTVFEVYATVMLGTDNSFETH